MVVQEIRKQVYQPDRVHIECVYLAGKLTVLLEIDVPWTRQNQ